MTDPASRHASQADCGDRIFGAKSLIGPNQARVMEWVLARGGDGVRTGLEDNIRIGRDRLARSNAELVSHAAEAIARHGGRPAAPAEARARLGLLA